MCRDVITVLLLAVPLALSATIRGHSGRPQSLPFPPPSKRSTGPENRRRCVSPKEHTNASIIGGDLVQSGDKYPFLAWLGDNDGTGLAQFCGGSLISDRVVMTAGHCVYDDEIKTKNIYVRFKLADFRSDQGVTRKVINWRRHERYNPFTLHYDIALLYLDESIPASVVKPVRISDGSKPFEKHGEKRITGWGSTDEECVVYDTLLRDATVPMGDYDDDCHTPGSKTVGKMEDFQVESQICAGMYRAGEMQYPGCGDSGGPLLADDAGEWTQIGFVSWSYGIPFPDVFTRVSHYKDWIEASSREMEAEGSFKR
mmetsp:Transcript_110069/g.311160  ORF Transcript_110069/g.311160 Transcript_110069/m.311160 type:complete len:313 (+) Transcript_110069:64-1002(+)